MDTSYPQNDGHGGVSLKRTSKQIILGQEYKAIDSLVFCGLVIILIGIVLTIMGTILFSEDDAVSFIFLRFLFPSFYPEEAS